ncbi:MAG TPA: hypothetical protein VGP40_05775 [Chthoniobacterales bacterium]|nr:hypothetical protein [Chthoniobacterales bacterium]
MAQHDWEFALFRYPPFSVNLERLTRLVIPPQVDVVHDMRCRDVYRISRSNQIDGVAERCFNLIVG